MASKYTELLLKYRQVTDVQIWLKSYCYEIFKPLLFSVNNHTLELWFKDRSHLESENHLSFVNLYDENWNGKSTHNI
jgi:hypothetical protein